ncbi:hypothetical protein ACNTMW_09265 [Planosporangium sp. 12N6]|uniref:hypothetical protein n=1 Tax=Planosporangium spinosum TaxID=3402278 RepID=UPI003CEB7154
MQRARRLALIAVPALVGSLALTGCRSQPGTALYVGSAQYSEKYVDQLADQLGKVSALNRGDGRRTITQWLVERDLGKRLVADKHWPKPTVDEQAAASEIENALPASNRSVEPLRPLIRLYAEYGAYRSAVQEHVAPAQPTDADYTELYQRYKDAGLLPAGMDEATFRSSLPDRDQQLIRPNLAIRELYREAIRKTNVTVNPKYALTELPLLETNSKRSIVAVPLNSKAGEPAVVPAATEQSQVPTNG